MPLLSSFTILRRPLAAIFIAFCALFVPISAMAQHNIEAALAADLYSTGKFADAAKIYTRLLHKEPTNELYYARTISCLSEMGDFKQAEKEVKWAIKRNPFSYSKEIDLGYMLSKQDKEKKANEQFEELVSSPKTIADATTLGLAFKDRQLYNWAKQTYEYARTKFSDPELFTAELAEIYRISKDYVPMITSYLDLIEAAPYQLDAVTNLLSEPILEEATYMVAKRLTLQRIAAQPDAPAFGSLLIWLFVQKGEWNAAAIQSKAMDKRFGSQGSYTYKLGTLAEESGRMEQAKDIYLQLLDNYPSSSYGVSAQKSLLTIRYRLLTKAPTHTQGEVDSLVADLEAFVLSKGITNTYTTEAVFHLAELKANYLGKYTDAVTLLKQYIEYVPDPRSKGRAKLVMADYLLMQGDPYEPSLLYDQVALDFKNAPLGHEAKFKNAKLSFYMGDFDWAKAQFDVLKSSTTELIANNAMQEALLIQDNLGLDSNTVALQLFADAELLVLRGKYDAAVAKLDTLERQHIGSSLADEILLVKANIAFKRGKVEAALVLYEQVFTLHKDDILADDAILKAAEIYDFSLNNTEEAMKLYVKLFSDYPGSIYSVQARERYRALRGDVLN